MANQAGVLLYLYNGREQKQNGIPEKEARDEGGPIHRDQSYNEGRDGKYHGEDESELPVANGAFVTDSSQVIVSGTQVRSETSILRTTTTTSTLALAATKVKINQLGVTKNSSKHVDGALVFQRDLP